MQKILMMTEDEHTLAQLYRILEREVRYQLTGVKGHAGVRREMNERIYHLGVLVFATLDEKDMEFIAEVKYANFTFPILVISEKMTQDQADRLNGYTDVHMIVGKMNDKNVLGLVRKMLVAKRVPKQIFKRFSTNQITELEALSSGDNVLSSMYNLSKGGAYCEFESSHDIGVGDVVRVKVSLTDANRTHVVNARVVWTTQRGRFSGRFGCGLKFVNAQDTYKALLSRA